MSLHPPPPHAPTFKNNATSLIIMLCMCLTLEAGSNTPKYCKNTFFMHIKSRDLYKIQTFYLVCVLGGKGGGVLRHIFFLQFFNNYTGMILLIRVKRMPTF